MPYKDIYENLSGIGELFEEDDEEGDGCDEDDEDWDQDKNEIRVYSRLCLMCCLDPVS